MFNKVFVFSLLIGAVTAQLKPGLYRIRAPEIGGHQYVAKSGPNVGSAVTLSYESRAKDLHELVSFLVSDMLSKLVLICDTYSG
jgi:hypothetical protein